MRRKAGSGIVALACFAGCVGFLTSCRQVMNVEPKRKPLDGSDFFSDGMSARPLVNGTVARGHLQIDHQLYEGKSGNAPAQTFPFPVTRQVLERGQERYNIYCSPCHGVLGNGDGVIVERGLKGPPSYHIDRLRNAPPGHFFDVITNGFGKMFSYGSRIPPEDRWAIVAYIRALQLSQQASLADVPSSERERLVRSTR